MNERATVPRYVSITTNAATPDAANKQTGFLQVNKDTGGGAWVAADNNVGHIYGRLGQGEKNDYSTTLGATTKAFQWLTTRDNEHAMLVSLLPYMASSGSTDALTNGQTVTLMAKGVAFMDNASELSYPVLPAASAPPDGKATVAHVSASLVALGAACYLGLY